ncbi:MAG: CcmD family protein [Bacteroidota bacterium]
MEFLSQNSLYIVLIIALVVWFGIYSYLFRIEAKIKALERRMKNKEGRNV